MKSQDIIPSRIYSWVYVGEVKMNVGGRAGVAPNPLNNQSVTKRAVYAGQAASHEMYLNALAKMGKQPDPSHVPRFEATSNPCIVKSLSNGKEQARILNPQTRKAEFFVNGNPATQEQVATITAYLPSKSPSAVKIMFPYVEHLMNVE